jgi:hypothetical protein
MYMYVYMYVDFGSEPGIIISQKKKKKKKKEEGISCDCEGVDLFIDLNFPLVIVTIKSSLILKG